jgi:predicted nucleotidyltransferase
MDVGRAAVTRALAEAGVRMAYLFGSRTSNRHRLDSDADIGRGSRS